MYFFVQDYQIGKTFETLEAAEQYTKLRASESGSNFKGAVAKIEFYAANRPQEVTYAQLSAEDYHKAIESRKQAYLAVGVDIKEDDYN